MAGDTEQDLLGDGRLLKEVRRAGEGRIPEPGEWVRVHYVCRLFGSSEVVDSSYDRGEPLKFTLAEGEVIPGWEAGVASMRRGELARLTVHPDLAYGAAGCGGGAVPAADAGAPGAAPGCLTYDIELLEVGRAVEEEDISPEECLQRALRAKDAGNAHFKAGEISRAADTYKGALQLLGHSDAERGSEEAPPLEEDVRWADGARREARERLLLACCLNLAQCELKLERFLDAAGHATSALGLDPGSSKALYRRGSANLGSGLLAQAKADLVRAARLEPRNGEIRAQLQACHQRIQESEQSDRSTFGGLFQRGSIYSEREEADGT